MKKYAAIVIIFLTVICIFSSDTLACSAFSLQYGGEHIFGKNHDWYVEGGMAFVTKRHVKKTAWPPPINADSEDPATWTSKYGSIIFMQTGVCAGMNETGLVVAQNALHQTVYPEPDSRHSINETEWLAYLLDNFRSVDEVIASDTKIRIRNRIQPVPYFDYKGSHYLISDRTGNTAVIEFLEGKMVCYTGGSIMINSPYAVSKDYEGDQFGSSFDSFERFYRIKMALKEAEPTSSRQAIEYAFGILDNVHRQKTMFNASPPVYSLTQLYLFSHRWLV